MAAGSATHLWILGTPSIDQLREWVLKAVPAAKEDEVLAVRLGQRTLLCAVNTADRTWWSRSVDVVSGVQPVGFESVFVGLYPDTDEWELVDRAGNQIDDEAKALAAARELVALELAELHHYVEWAHELEDLDAGALVSGLGVPVEALNLGLPPGPARSKAVAAPPAAVVSGLERSFNLALLLPLLLLGLAGPVLAWWNLLPTMLSPIEAPSVVLIVLMESAFALPFVLVWRRLPHWARAVVIAVHLGSFIAGVFRVTEFAR